MVRVMLDFLLILPLIRSSPRKRGSRANVLAVGLDSRSLLRQSEAALASRRRVRGNEWTVAFAHTGFSLARSSARILCGVAGISSISTPNGDNASLIALITAAGAPMVPPSPRPLARVTEFWLGVSMWWSSISGISWAVGGR